MSLFRVLRVTVAGLALTLALVTAGQLSASAAVAAPESPLSVQTETAQPTDPSSGAAHLGVEVPDQSDQNHRMMDPTTPETDG